MTTKKITLATIKSFIKANRAQLQIRTLTKFDGMTDGLESCKDRSFRPAVEPNRQGRAFRSTERDNTLGIEGAWFVFDSGDRFRPYDVDGFNGYEVYNCCGHFILAVRAPAPAAVVVSLQATV